MPRLAHRILVLVGLALALTAGRAAAQDNFDANKTPAQLFANDCSGCHKSPVGLAKSPGIFGVESFLREHYTASRQAAAAIAGYLKSVDAEQGAAPPKRGKSEPRRKAEKPSKKDDGKASESKAEKKTEPKSEAKSEAKPESKPEAKPETKPAEAKVEVKPAESKPAEPAKTEKSE
jgi:outer membrane biosynthesis protein TonB